MIHESLGSAINQLHKVAVQVRSLVRNFLGQLERSARTDEAVAA